MNIDKAEEIVRDAERFASSSPGLCYAEEGLEAMTYGHENTARQMFERAAEMDNYFYILLDTLPSFEG